MYRARTKKQELRRRLLTYTIVPVIIAVGVSLLVMYTIGYRYNSDDRTLEQGGLVQLISQPTGATVEVDGVKLPSKTNTRLDAATGSHTFMMTKPGYSTWQKTVTVEPGKLLWLNYAWLIPKNLNISTVASFDEVDQAVALYEKNQFLLIIDRRSPMLNVIDLSNRTVATEDIPIDRDLYINKENSKEFSIYSVDKSGRYAIVKAQGKTIDWLLIDLINPDRSQNISAIVSDKITQVMFLPTDSGQLYIVTKSLLRQINLSQRTVSAPIVSNVRDVSMSAEGVIAYVSAYDKQAGQRTVGYYTPGASEPYVLRRVYDDGKRPIEFRISEYDDSRYGVLRVDDNLEVFSMQSEPSDTDSSITTSGLGTISLPEGSDYLTISPNGRFILSQKSSTFITYDLELTKVTTSTLKGDTAVTSQLQWLDDYHIWSDRSGKLYIYEFDGENVQSIANVISGKPVLLSEDGKRLWLFDQSNGKTIIKSANLQD